MPGCGFTLISARDWRAFLGTFVGVAQKNPKAVLAYSSISQMGIIMTGLGIARAAPEAWLQIAGGGADLRRRITRWPRIALLGRWRGGTQRAPEVSAWPRGSPGLLLPALRLGRSAFTSGALARPR